MILGNEKGFTLVELVVAAGLVLIVLGAIGAVFRMQSHTAKAQEYRLEAQEYARAVLDMMVREMRNTGYFPTGTVCPTPANTNGIVAATAVSFQFVYDADGFNGCADANENVTYAYNSTGCPTGFGNITRKEGANAAQPLTDCNVPTGGFTLTYYAQNSTTAMSPIVLATIQRVLISLTVQSKSADTTFSGQASSTMVSNADLRNRGLP